jgi:hypothetical protein
MRVEELRAELAAAAAGVPDGHEPVGRAVERRWRRARRTKLAVGVVAVTAVAVAIGVGPSATDRQEAAPAPTPPAPSGTDGTTGRLVIPGVSTPIVVVGPGQLAVHDPQTGDRTVTPVPRLNGTTTATMAVALGPWIVVATGGGPGSRAFALDTRDPGDAPRPLGPAVTVLASATPGLVWLADADGRARQVTLGGLQATDPVALPGPLVGVTDVGLLVQAPTGATVVDPVTAVVSWSAPDATALAGEGRRVAWCDGGCRRVNVTEIGGATTVLPSSPGAIGSYTGPAAFSPDGRWLAVTRGPIVIVHDATGARPAAVLSGGGNGSRSLTWTGDWLVFSGGTALETAEAPSFTAVRYVDAGIAVRAVVSLGVVPEAGGPTVIAGGPFYADGWFVRAGIRTIDAVTDVCFGVLGPPLGECMATEGGPVEARVIGSGSSRTVVGVVRDARIGQVRVIRNGTADPVLMENPELVRVQGGYRVFAWRVATGAGVANVSGLAPDGQFVAGVAVSLG